MSTRGKDKKRHLDEVIDGALLIAKVTKDANESLPVLNPLKATMGSVIILLENMKVNGLYSQSLYETLNSEQKVRRNKEDWKFLAEILQKRMQSVQEAVDGKPASAALHDLVSKYCDGYTNCYTGNTWDSSLCPDNATCAKNCALDGADYSGTYGITTSGNALTLKFKTGSNIGSRVYLLASDTAYQMFKLKNQEFTFDVDVSKLGCGLNGAVYFSEMDADGGMSKYSTNKAGAKYGTGYCDAQCPHDIKFINGQANVEGWEPSANDKNAGKGKYGSCCSEMDIWEANKIAAAYTPHGCTVAGPYRCSGTECGDGDNRYGGVCDKDGCDFNSYRMGDTSFYGEGKTVDTKSKFTIVTQFITSDGTANGALKEIRRLYVQNGKVIQNSKTNISGMDAFDSITAEFCAAQKTAFGDRNDWLAKGGYTPMDKAMTKGMVLVLSIWDDHEVNMLWLDSTYPTDSTKPGAAR
ncbi:4860_t:CDS:2, partial [Acaulospora colombiana]